SPSPSACSQCVSSLPYCTCPPLVLAGAGNCPGQLRPLLGGTVRSGRSQPPKGGGVCTGSGAPGASSAGGSSCGSTDSSAGTTSGSSTLRVASPEVASSAQRSSLARTRSDISSFALTSRAVRIEAPIWLGSTPTVPSSILSSSCGVASAA